MLSEFLVNLMLLFAAVAVMGCFYAVGICVCDAWDSWCAIRQHRLRSRAEARRMDWLHQFNARYTDIH